MRMRSVGAALLCLALCAPPAFAKGKDSEGDGMPDRWETIHGTEPRFDDAKRDPDQDQLKNIDEFRNHSEPRDHDSDNDTIWDGTEVHESHTKPNKYDSDGDGLSDGAEVYAFPETFVTDANNPDSDGDGVLDGDEDADGDGVANEDEDDDEDCSGQNFRDRDRDSVADEDENEQGTAINQYDSDDDGVTDGREDSDGDGTVNEDEDDFSADECLARGHMDESLKNAATAEESFSTNGNGYTTDPEMLRLEGFRATEDVTVTVPFADNVNYCIEAHHDDFASLVKHYSSTEGAPMDGACP
jgi:hypothetical protein